MYLYKNRTSNLRVKNYVLQQISNHFFTFAPPPSQNSEQSLKFYFDMIPLANVRGKTVGWVENDTPPGAGRVNTLSVQFHSDSFIRRCCSITLWRNNVFHSLSKNYNEELLKVEVIMRNFSKLKSANTLGTLLRNCVISGLPLEGL